MSAVSVVYVPGRDNFEIKTLGVVYVLSPEQADQLLYHLEHAVWDRQRVVAE